jgi:hypothetical protein
MTSVPVRVCPWQNQKDPNNNHKLFKPFSIHADNKLSTKRSYLSAKFPPGRSEANFTGLENKSG